MFIINGLGPGVQRGFCGLEVPQTIMLEFRERLIVFFSGGNPTHGVKRAIPGGVMPAGSTFSIIATLVSDENTEVLNLSGSGRIA